MQRKQTILKLCFFFANGQLQTDPALYKMLTLGEQDVEGVTRNLSNELSIAKETLRGLSAEIKTNAISQWAGISF